MSIFNLQNRKNIATISLAAAVALAACTAEDRSRSDTELAPEATVSATASSPTGAVKVEVVETDGKYQLLRAGEPYEVKGAGIEFLDMEIFASHGGNSFRTWTIDHEDITGQDVLDKAHELGLTVALNLPIHSERHGYDYNDEAFVAEQLELSRQYVIKYKDHPALLSWIIGNELNFSFTNPKVYDAVNDISKMIHELDPNHPTTTTLAGYNTEVFQTVLDRAPDLDFVSVQMYGDLINLPNISHEMASQHPCSLPNGVPSVTGKSVPPNGAHRLRPIAQAKPITTERATKRSSKLCLAR